MSDKRKARSRLITNKRALREIKDNDIRLNAYRYMR